MASNVSVVPPLLSPSSKGDKTPVDIDAITNHITIVLYSITVLLGTVGNTIVIWIARMHLRPKVTYVWLVNLAVADLIFCLTRAISLAKKIFFDYWPFGVFLCKFNGFFKYTNMFCSVFFLAVISVDRALCVWRPIFSKRHRTLCAARIISTVVWVVASAMSTPFFVYRQVYKDKNNLSKCSLQEKEIEGGITAKTTFYTIRFVCGFLLPFLVILCCYLLAGMGIQRTRLNRKSRHLRILAGLVCAFFLCWAPYHFLQLVKMTNGKTQAVKVGLTLAQGLAYFNSCVNPLLYFCMGYNMRHRRLSLTMSSKARRSVDGGEPTTKSQENVVDNSSTPEHAQAQV